MADLMGFKMGVMLIHPGGKVGWVGVGGRAVSFILSVKRGFFRVGISGVVASLSVTILSVASFGVASLSVASLGKCSSNVRFFLFVKRFVIKMEYIISCDTFNLFCQLF